MSGIHLGQQVDVRVGHSQHHPLIQEADHDDILFGSQGQLAFHLQIVLGQKPKPCAVSVAFQQPEPGEDEGQHQAQDARHFQGLATQTGGGWQIIDGGRSLLGHADGRRQQNDSDSTPDTGGPNNVTEVHDHL